MYTESFLLPLSAIQHLLFCERQAALIHVEQLWAENRLTAQGRVLHRRAHEGKDQWRGSVRIVRGLAIRSLDLGLAGKTDVVEFAPKSAAPDADGREDDSNPAPARVPLKRLFAHIRGSPGDWRVTPIEYKRGRPKKDDSDRVQICAQAICLEEMLGVEISSGELFYGVKRRRTAVLFGDSLRETTRAAARRLHEIFASGETPRVDRQPKCRNCSLLNLCLPDASGPSRSASRFVGRQFAAHTQSDGPTTDPWESAQST